MCCLFVFFSYHRGLDDFSCSQCVQLLQGISKGGRTVIASIHAPSAKIFAIFEHVYVLAGKLLPFLFINKFIGYKYIAHILQLIGGNCVYRGAGNNIIKYAQKIGLECPISHNPADFSK